MTRREYTLDDLRGTYIKRDYTLDDLKGPYVKRQYTLDDLKGQYVSAPRYESLEERRKNFEAAIESEKRLNRLLENTFFKRANFTSATTNLFKPIIDTQKESTKLIVDNNKTIDQKLEQLEYKTQAQMQLMNKEKDEQMELENKFQEYLDKVTPNDYFSIEEFKDGKYRFNAQVTMADHDYLQDTHRLEFDFEIKNIRVWRENNKEFRDYKLTENVLRLLTLNITEVGDLNAVDIYKRIVYFALGPELIKIKNAGKAISRKEILSVFRNDQKFIKLIAPYIGIGIKPLSFNDKNTNGDGLGHTRIIVIPPNPNDQIKRLLVLLGTKNSLGKDSYNIGLEEFTAILDELLKTKQINKLTYKTFLLKYKHCPP